MSEVYEKRNHAPPFACQAYRVYEGSQPHVLEGAKLTDLNEHKLQHLAGARADVVWRLEWEGKEPDDEDSILAVLDFKRVLALCIDEYRDATASSLV